MKRILCLTALLSFTVINARTADTAENWQKHCGKCHGAEGKGETKMGKKAGVRDMTTAEFQGRVTDEQAFKAVREGLTEHGKEKMKPNKELSDTEIKALVAHVRTFKK